MKILKINSQEDEMTDLPNYLEQSRTTHYQEKRPFLTLGILIFLLFAGLPILKAQTTVNPGDDLNSIINNSSGETITVNSGTYAPLLIEYKNFSATNPLVIKAAEGANVTIQRSNWNRQNPHTQSYDAAVFTECSYIAFDNIKFTGGGQAFSINDRGVWVHDSHHMIFRNCEFTETQQEGVKVEAKSEYIDFIDCLFADSGLGPQPWYGEGLYVGRGSYNSSPQEWPDVTNYVWIEGCEFRNTGRAEAINIKAEAFHCTIRDNYIHDITLNDNNSSQTNEGAISLDHSLGYGGATYQEGVRRENWVENNRIERIRTGKSNQRIAGIYSAGTGNNIVGNTVTDVTNGNDPSTANGIRFNDWSNDITPNIIWNNESIDAENGDAFGNLATNQEPPTNPNNAQSWYPTGSSNSLSWNTSPISISNGDNTFILDYSIGQAGLVIVQLFDTNWNYIGQALQNVSPGTSQATLTLNVNNLSDDNYIIQGELRNPNWGDIGVAPLSEEVSLIGTPPPSSNSLSWNTSPTSISNGDNTFTLDYSIDQAGLVIVQLFDTNWNYIGQALQNVSPGASQVTLTLNVNNLSDDNYIIQAELRNPNWGDIGVAPLGEEVSLIGTPPPSSNSLSWNPIPTSISNGDNSITVDYSINQNGILAVHVYDSNWQLIGQVVENVSAGTYLSTLTLPANGVSTNNNHIEAQLLNPSWGDIGVPTLEATVSGSIAGNSLSWNPTPTSISNGSNQITLDYSIDQDGLVLVQLYDANWNYIDQAFQNVSPGADQATLTLNVNGLSWGSYLFQAELWNSSWSDIGVPRLREWVSFDGNNKIVSDLSQHIYLSPNPADHSIQLTCEISENTQADIQVYNALGKLVKQIPEVEIIAGTPTEVEVSQLPAGVYFCTLQSGEWQAVKKFVIAR